MKDQKLPEGEVFLLSFFIKEFGFTREAIEYKINTTLKEWKLELRRAVTGADKPPKYLNRKDAETLFQFLVKEAELKNFTTHPIKAKGGKK